MKCNICEVILHTDEKSINLLEHIQSMHQEVYDLHKENPEATVGFRIEFLHLNVLNDDGDPKTEPVMVGEVCETTTEKEDVKDIVHNDHSISYLPDTIIKSLKKTSKRASSDHKKKSWVWKYFDCISDIIYRCTLCEAVISIKASNTNNMNRHIRMRHQNIFEAEMAEKVNERMVDNDLDSNLGLIVKRKLCFEKPPKKSPKGHRLMTRRSWIWQYFDRMSSKLAQCKLCERIICHGGHATGNMNRHLKMIHNKTGRQSEEHNWIWKVFDRTKDDFFTCKICQYRSVKYTELEKNTSSILQHLKLEHGVVSGDQIITSNEGEAEDDQ